MSNERPTWFKDEDERRKATEDRGYSLTDMHKTKEILEGEWREWKRRFQNLLDILVNDGERGIQAVRHAEELADAEQEMLNRRKPQGIGDE